MITCSSSVNDEFIIFSIIFFLSSISIITLFSLILLKYSSGVFTSNSFPKNLCPFDLLELLTPSISNSTTLSPYKAKNHSIGLANLNALSAHLIDFGNVSSKTKDFNISGNKFSVG